jgi:hypothetical protein
LLRGETRQYFVQAECNEKENKDEEKEQDTHPAQLFQNLERNFQMNLRDVNKRPFGSLVQGLDERISLVASELRIERREIPVKPYHRTQERREMTGRVIRDSDPTMGSRVREL